MFYSLYYKFVNFTQNVFFFNCLSILDRVRARGGVAEADFSLSMELHVGPEIVTWAETRSRMLSPQSHPGTPPINVFYSSSFLDLGQDPVHLLLVTVAFFNLEQFFNLSSFGPWSSFEEYSPVISPVCFYSLCVCACVFIPIKSLDAWILLLFNGL